MSAAEIQLLITAKNNASGVLKAVGNDADGLNSRVGSLGSKMGTAMRVGAFGALAGVAALGIGLKSVIGDAIEAENVMKQTETVLISTGGASGLTARQISDMAGALSRVTPFADDTIQAGQNMLLTFTKIGKDVFPQATETMLNMSQALGQDLQSSAVQLGKALNDPIAGVTALRKVGVALTDQQRDQIKAFVESGDVLSAQKIILQELEVEFGNSARAAGETFGGKMAILNNQIGELREGIGLALLPVLTALADLAIRYVVPALESGIAAVGDFLTLIRSSLTGDVGKAAEAFNRLPAPLQQLALWLAKNQDEIKAVAAVALALGRDVLSGLILIVRDLTKFFGEHKEMLIIVGIAIAALLIWLYAIPVAIIAITVGIALLRTHWESIMEYFRKEFPALHAVAVFYFEMIKNQITTAINVIRDVIVIVMALLKGDWGAAWEGVKQLGLDLFEGFVTDLTLKLGFLRDIFALVFEGIRATVGDKLGAAADAAAGPLGVMQDAFDVVRQSVGWLADRVWQLIDAIDSIPSIPGGLKDLLNAGKNALPGGGLLPRLAGGGAANGWTIVGEQGAELLNLPAGSHVYSNAQSRQMLRGEVGVPAGNVTNHYYIDRVEVHGDVAQSLAALGVTL